MGCWALTVQAPHTSIFLFHSVVTLVLLLQYLWPYEGARPPPCSREVVPAPPGHSLQDSTLLQAVLATVPHGCVVYSLNGPVNCLEDILLHALKVGGQLDLGAKWGRSAQTQPRLELGRGPTLAEA